MFQKVIKLIILKHNKKFSNYFNLSQNYLDVFKNIHFK